MSLYDPKLRNNWPTYLFQSVIAGLVILLAFNLPALQGDIILVASLGSSAFLVFSLPTRVTASLKNCVFGHAWGLLAGVICFQGHQWVGSGETLFYAAAVTLAFLGMVGTNTDHPPAAGTALAVAMNNISWQSALWMLGMAALIAGAKTPLRGVIRDLRD